MKKSSIMRVIGLTALAAGFVLFVYGLFNFVTCKDVELSFEYFRYFMIGVPLVGIGGMLTVLGFSNAIMKCGMKRRAEMLSKMAEAAPKCDKCGTANMIGAKYCSNCGEKLS